MGFKDLKATNGERGSYPSRDFKGFSQGMVLLIITVLGLWRGMILKGETWLTDLKGFSIYYSHEVLQVYRFYRF